MQSKQQKSDENYLKRKLEEQKITLMITSLFQDENALMHTARIKSWVIVMNRWPTVTTDLNINELFLRFSGVSCEDAIFPSLLELLTEILDVFQEEWMQNKLS